MARKELKKIYRSVLPNNKTLSSRPLLAVRFRKAKYILYKYPRVGNKLASF